MKTIKSWAKFLVWFVLVFGCLRAWKVDGVENAGNLLQFLLWFWAVAGLVCGLSSPKGTVSHPDAVLLVTGRASALVLILALAWYGHSILALTYLLGWAGRSVYRGKFGADGKPLPPGAQFASQDS